MLVTASWFTPLPDTHCRIGISRGTPRGAAAKGGFRQYRRLAPAPWLGEVDREEYRDRYFAEILGPLDPQAMVDDLRRLADGKAPALLCFERVEVHEFCHRGLVSAWLHDTLGLEVPEFGCPTGQVGWQHPLLPPGMMP